MPIKNCWSSSSTSTCRRSHRRASPHQESSLAPQPTQCSGDPQPGALDSASFFSSVEKVGLDLDRIDAMPVRALAARQQEIDRGRGGARTVDRAWVAEGLAKMAAFGMRLELEQRDH